MKVKITMVNGDSWDFENPAFNSIMNFIDNQVCSDYYVIDPKKGMAIRCSNILKIEHLDVKGEQTE